MDGDERRLARRARGVRRALRVQPGEAGLEAIDPRSTPGLRRRPAAPKAWSAAEVARLTPLLAGRQERLWAAAQAGLDRRRVLLVLQAMDCGGKDGTIKAVLGTLNPQGVRITSFTAPTPEQLAHHFLWRISAALPAAGYIGVFNRSHYEDVLAVRVRELAPAAVWRGRYDEINDFERAQAADGTVIVKIMLHISYAEQRRRLRQRLDDPTKRWKFREGDLDDRRSWGAYQRAYADALARCGAEAAPWYVVPADRKWYRDWAVANILLAHLDESAPDYPSVDLDLPRLHRRLADDETAESSASGERKVNKG